MTQTADPEDGHEVGGACARDLDRLVGGDPGTGEGRGVERVDVARDFDHVAGIGAGVLAEGPVKRVAHVLLLETQRLPPETQYSHVPQA